MTSVLDTATILWHYFATKRKLASIRTTTDLNRVQETGLAHFRKNVLSKSPLYSIWNDRPLSSLPIIGKADMLENFDLINTRGIRFDDAMALAKQAERDRDFSPSIGDVTVGLSSGTSGRQGIFLVSKAERLKWAGIMLAHAMPHSILKPTRIAFFLRANSNLYTTLNRGRHLTLDFYDITQGRLLGSRNYLSEEQEFFIEALTRTNPDVIVAPASILRHLAGQSRDLRPVRVFSVGEVLDPSDKVYIEEAFQVPVHEIYQCTEGFLGISDQSGRLLLNEAFVHIEKEWIDEASGRFNPIITDFSRTTQPIVRYRLDDVLVVDRDYEGPFTAITAIEGRADSVLYFPGKDGTLKPVFADAVRQAITSSDLRYADWRIVQTAPDEIEYMQNPTPGPIHRETLQSVLNDLASRYDCEAPTGTVSYHPPQPFDVKKRRISRTFTLPGNTA